MKNGIVLLIDHLRRELKSKNLKYWFDTSKFKNTVNLKIQK